MIENFEDITTELSSDEMKIIPFLISGFKGHQQKNPIKAPEIVRTMNDFLKSREFKIRMTEPRLRKCCNYIRSMALLPLIATSEGYFCSYQRDIIESQIRSLEQRARGIQNCAQGLKKFITHAPDLIVESNGDHV